MCIYIGFAKPGDCPHEARSAGALRLVTGPDVHL